MPEFSTYVKLVSDVFETKTLPIGGLAATLVAEDTNTNRGTARRDRLRRILEVAIIWVERDEAMEALTSFHYMGGHKSGKTGVA